MGSAFAYCDCGTSGPLGAGAAGGAGGVSCPGAPPVWMIEVGLRSKPAIHDSNRLVTKKPAARNAVVRVSTFAVPRPVIKPLVELTSPPPSDFCNSTTQIG